MKCLNCGQDNKDAARACKKCGRDLSLAPSWFPTWRWHVRTLATIYSALIVLFFAAKFILAKLPPPYNIRYIPPEMTPWLKNRPEPKITLPNAFDYMSAADVEYGTATVSGPEKK